MEGLREFLEDLKRQGYARDNFLGLLNLLIGRRIQTSTGTILSDGLTWRAVASWLQKARWDKDAVRELGLDPHTLAPRDRVRYWYQAIARAGVYSPAAMQAGQRLAEVLRSAGYVIGPEPGATSTQGP